MSLPPLPRYRVIMDPTRKDALRYYVIDSELKTTSQPATKVEAMEVARKLNEGETNA